MSKLKTQIEPRFNPVEHNGVSAKPRAAVQGDVPMIVSFINAENQRSGAVLAVDEDTVKGWVDKKSSFVLVDPVSLEVVAHVAVVKWPKCHEMRSVVVADSYKGSGVYAEMTDSIIRAIFKANPITDIIQIKNESSNGISLLTGRGFQRVPNGLVMANGVVFSDPTMKKAFSLRLEDYTMKLSLIKEARGS